MKASQHIWKHCLIAAVCCLIAAPSWATSPVDLGALTKGCLDASKPEALARCKKLCKDGFKFYCDAIKDAVPPEEVAQPAPPPVATSGTCNIPDDKLPKVEWSPPEEYAPEWAVLTAKASTKVGYLEHSCNKDSDLNSCKVLCKIGCKQYCNYCELAKAACARGDKCLYYGNYKFFEHSLVPDSTDMANVGDELEIIHNCNPATKKRGVGIIPGGDESFIGFGYGRFGYCKGMCSELLVANIPPLRRAFEAGELGDKDEYDGIPTRLELIWAGHNMAICHPFFLKWLHPFAPGASAELALRPEPGAYPGTSLYDQFAPLVTLEPGVHEYPLPPYEDGSPRSRCGISTIWIDSPGQQQQEENYANECRAGSSFSCNISCKQGNQESCALQQEWRNKESCEGTGGHPNAPACKKLCETGKPQYQKYCAEDPENRRRSVGQ